MPGLKFCFVWPGDNATVPKVALIGCGTSEGYGKCVQIPSILEHFEGKNVANSKYASRRLQSPQKRAQSTEHVLITKYDAGEVLITPLELRARSI